MNTALNPPDISPAAHQRAIDRMVSGIQDSTLEALEAAAPLIAAAELERIADELQVLRESIRKADPGRALGLADAIYRIRQRAVELKGEG